MIRICCDYRNGTGCMAENPADAARCACCGRPLHYAINAYAVGEQVGPYQVHRRIGQGGFGAVYQVADVRSPDHSYALKVSFDPDAVAALQREFALLERLRHDHLPRYIDMFSIDGYGHLVMEFIPGQSLEDVLRVRGAALPAAQVLGYAIQLCQVIGDLHSNTPPIIHRDIKPANIRITPDGRIVLVDFGLVKRGGEQTVQSLRGVGTIQYAPFEQFGRGTTDERSDQYSLAATLYHLVSGQPPASIVERISGDSDALVPPELINSVIAPHVSRALMTALAIRPAERWPSMSTFGQALLGAAVEPVAPAAPTPPSSLPWGGKPTQTPETSSLPWSTFGQTTNPPPAEGGLPWNKLKRDK
ncbi:MAG: serine/threonine protein kinase [Oscillochloris sp.]|nr:serine/threonine protein kinase [Oscillochloris sp.]